LISLARKETKSLKLIFQIESVTVPKCFYFNQSNNMKNEITHPLERYKLIADPTIRQQCIDNFNEYRYIAERENDKGTLYDAIDCGIWWRATPEGYDYWSNVHNDAIDGTLPLLPEPIEEPSEIDQLRTENDKLRECLQSYYDKDYLWLTDNDIKIFESKVKQLLNK
jgi:hypothetical protein